MVIVYGSRAVSAVRAQVVKSLAHELGLTVQMVSSPSPQAISLRVMTALLNTAESRTEVVFIDSTPDIATERFLAQQRDQVRSVAVLGDESYEAKSREFDRATAFRDIALFNPSGKDTHFEKQLLHIFEDEDRVRRVYQHHVELAQALMRRKQA